MILSATQIFVPNNQNVKADAGGGGGQEGIGLDNDFLYDVTYNLSRIIYDSYLEPGDLPKGRFFGSVGEHDAAYYLNDTFNNVLGITAELDRIDENFTPPIFVGIGYRSMDLDDSLMVNKCDITLNGPTGSDLIEGHIRPQWDLTGLIGGGFLEIIPVGGWFDTKYNVYDREELTRDISLSDLKIIPKPTNYHFLSQVFSQFSDEFENFEGETEAEGFNFILTKMEEYYDFTFADLNESNHEEMLSGLNNTFASFYSYSDFSEPFVFIAEDPAFNPDPQYFDDGSLLDLGIFGGFFGITNPFEIEAICWTILDMFQDNCRGIILYDHNNETYDMETRLFIALPTIYINGTIGNEIMDDYESYTLDYDLNQKWEEHVDSYNVIGEIDGTHPRKTVYVQCLYDGWWNQGSGDSAVGMGIVMSIAKYMKELESDGIKPYCTVKFIGYSGEEAGLKGAWQHEYKNRNIFDIGKKFIDILNEEKLVTIIDLNQLGFDQTDPKMTFDIFINDNGNNDKKFNERTWAIAEETNYVERCGNVNNFTTVSLTGSEGWNYAGDQMPFVYNKVKQKTQHILSFLKTKGPDEDLMVWKYHHRSGEEHVQGDSMLHFNWEDANLSAELIWNFTKYFAYKTDCWFNDSASSSFIKIDSDADNDDDTIRATFTIDTTLPHDIVTARAKLISGITVYTIKREDFVIKGKTGEVTMDVTLPPNAVSGSYKLKVELLDSVERIQDKLYKNRGPLRLRGWPDDTKTSGTLFGLHPVGNTEPGQTAIDHIDDLPIKVLEKHNYSFNATDQDGDYVKYVIDWNALIPLWGRSLNLNPDIVESGQDYIKGHTYLLPGPKLIEAFAREHYGQYADWSKWGIYGERGDSGYFNIGCVKFNLYVTADPYFSSESLSALVNEATPFYGHVFGEEAVQSYLWTFENPAGQSSTEFETKNVEKTYTQAGNFSVWFNVTDIYGKQSNFSSVIQVKETLSDFNISSNFSIKPFETVYFNDSSKSINNITGWNWTFGDGTNATGQNVTHVYNYSGEYNVTLTVADDENNVDVYNKFVIINIDFDPPEILDSRYEIINKDNVSTAVIVADVVDYGKRIVSVGINITSPTMEYYNLSMNRFLDDTYYVYFNSTEKSGNYSYTIWTKDNKNHTSTSSVYQSHINSVFGNVKEENNSQTINNRVTGSVFTQNEYCTVDSITRVHPEDETVAYPPGPPRMKCMIFRANDSQLIGTTEEKIGMASTFNFSEPKPVLINDTEYILTIWGSNSNAMVYYDECDDERGRYLNNTYNRSFQDPILWVNESRLYSIYCDFTPENKPPDIDDAIAASGTVGFGDNVIISANVADGKSGVYTVVAEVIYPDGSEHYLYLNNGGNSSDGLYGLNFTDTWLTGTYYYTILAYDNYQNENFSSNHSFNVSVNATMSVCTTKDSYGANETINITDPPGDQSDIGYELLDDGDVLHIWNKYDSYYFNTSSGIQLTNHYDDYWTHNVLMLGYYNNDQWNLIYRTDELSGFNKDIDTDNETFVNATLWKDLSYGGYDFRLAIRYHLGVDDNELTVIPYIKNLGDAIPYTLGFAWEINDIQVDMTPEDDYIEINGTSFCLNETVDVNFMNMTTPVYCWNETTNESYVCGYEAIPYFYIREDKSGNQSESLYLKWDESLDYVVRVKSRDGEYNAPVTLAFKIGTLGVDQEKFTELLWHDASEVVYYFNSYDPGEAWPANPGNMADGSISTYASFNNILGPSSVELCTRNTCPRFCDLGTISKVELRAYGYYSGSQRDIILRPVYGGTEDGDNYTFQPRTESGWSSWFDTASDVETPWSWDDIRSLDCDVEAEDDFGFWTLYCSKVELRVTYIPHPTEISDPYPADGSTGVGIAPLLNITVSDPQGDDMNITWLSNSSGSSSSWQVFGVNSSVGNGTYHQTFSNASVNGQWWYWKVNVSDENGEYKESDVFKFYTGYQSKIVNKGSTSISGYLLIQVRYYNETMELWEVDNNTIDETSLRTINADSTLALDIIFNGNVGTDDLINGDGTYCVFAALRDEYGEILECDDLSLLYAYCEFEVDTS